MKKAQISSEFLFTAGIIVFIFLIILGFSIERRLEIGKTESELNKRNECFKISNLITSAFINGEGSSINTKINHDVSIISQSKIICVEDFCCSLTTSAVSNDELSKGLLIIENNDNKVKVKNV